MIALTLTLMLCAGPPNEGGGDALSAEAPAAAAKPATEAPSSKRRWELGKFDVRGTAPKPGVVFIEAEREKTRAVMQALMAETRSGGLADVEVSRPAELPVAAPQIFKFEARGPVRKGKVLKAIEGTLSQLQDCRRAERARIPTDLVVELVLILAEDGQVQSGKLIRTHPSAPRAGRCVLSRVKRGEFPVSPAGTIKVDVGIRLPPPLSVAKPLRGTPGR